jgi:hypothetical protein
MAVRGASAVVFASSASRAGGTAEQVDFVGQCSLIVEHGR